MKIRKILSVAAASALAVSAIATNAFADAAHSGSYSFSDSTWWTQDWIMGGDSGKPVSDLIGDVDPSTVKSITFTSDTVFVIGYNNTEGGWSQPSDQTSYTLTDVLLESYTDDAGETHDPALCLCLSKGDGVEYTINWEVEADGAAAPSEPADEAPKFDKTYKATMAFADGSWAAQDWDTTIDVDGYGTHSIKANVESFSGLMVFCVDIADLGADLGVESTDDVHYDMSKINVKDVKVIVDGAEVAVDNSKVLWGDVEANGKLRIEIYNEYGETKDNSPIDKSIAGSSLEVQFTLEPVNDISASEDNKTDESKPEESKPEESKPEESKPEENNEPVENGGDDKNATDEPNAAGDVNQPTADKNSPDTGIEGVAVVAGLAVVAALGVVVAKKRK